MSRSQLSYIALFLCATALGGTIAYYVGMGIQLRRGQDSLRNYAHRLLDESPQLVTESDRAVATVLNANLGFCSDEELALMRDYVYNAVHVKHIGRIIDGKLYCTSGVGRLSPPEHMPRRPEIDVDGLHIYRVPRIVITNYANDAAGLVVERRGVSTVMNPNSYRTLDESPMLSSGFLIDPRNSHTIPLFGHHLAISDSEIAAGNFIERSGLLLQPLCSKRELICVVASAAQADILASNTTFLRSLVTGGMILGSAASVLLVLELKKRGSLAQQLRRAVRRGNLSLVYQPVVELDSGAIVGAEALVRWIDDCGNRVGPDVFIALAEEQGFVGEITQWVIRQVTQELGDVLVRGKYTVTINVSSHDLTDPRVFQTLEESMRSASLASAAIGLEVTERSTADHETAIDAVARLKEAGHTVYIDDFGTGFSNLGYLHRLAADAIKIDRVFTNMVGANATATSIVPQILAMAKHLGLRVVVEGIETQEQADYFRAASSDLLAQGYLFSPGVPAAEIKKIFSAQVLANEFPSEIPSAKWLRYANSTAA